MKTIIETSNAPSAIGPYSQAVRVGSTLYLSGQIGLNPDTMDFAGADIAAQANQVFKNMQAVLTAAGVTTTEVVKLTIFLIEFAHFPLVNDLMKQYFNEPYPARSTVQVAALPKGALVEVEAIAVIE
jgi:reactive intermediate/imine deaminase